MASSFYFKQLELGPMQNFVYLIGDREKKECFVVDPAWDVETVLNETKNDGMKITGALVTHCHFDHVNGIEPLLQATDAKVYVNRQEAEFLKVAQGRVTGIFLNITGPNLVAVSGGDKVKIGSLELEFLHTPGHTPGSQCFLVQKSLVAGDTLFIGYCGRCDLPGGDPQKMHESLGKLAKLDNEIMLYPGHNYSDAPFRAMGEEKKSNPYLKAGSMKDFTQAMTGLLDE